MLLPMSEQESPAARSGGQRKRFGKIQSLVDFVDPAKSRKLR